MSSRTIFLAKIYGLYCLILSLAIFVRGETVMATLTGIFRDPPLLLVTGIIAICIGLAIVLSHNEWHGGALTVMVTLLGWASLLKGMMILLLSPEKEAEIFVTDMRYNQHPYVVASVLLALGAYFSISGFTNREEMRAR